MWPVEGSEATESCGTWKIMQVEDIKSVLQLDVVIRSCAGGTLPSPAPSIDQGPGLMVGWS